jgi:hypothetical protein
MGRLDGPAAVTQLAGDRAAGRERAEPDRRELWRWVWATARPYIGWLLALLGAVALLLGWWGVSGEALTAKQLPYLVSGGLTGVALIVLAAVFLGTDDVRRQLARVTELERKVDELHALFAAELDAAPTTTSGAAHDGAVLALPSGTSYHRPDCTLVSGKTEAAPVTAAAIARRSLRPCRVCDPAARG